MGVYIKGMEMPTRCYTCPCADLEFLDCNLMPGTRIEQHKRLDDCPLVPVPPNGRLIDADANIASLERCLQSPENDLAEFAYSYARAFLSECPTIIPAEEGNR